MLPRPSERWYWQPLMPTSEASPIAAPVSTTGGRVLTHPPVLAVRRRERVAKRGGAARRPFDRALSVALITPSAVAIAVFVYGFIAWTAWVSLTNWNSLVPFNGILPRASFVGLQTYQRLFENAR